MMDEKEKETSLGVSLCTAGVSNHYGVTFSCLEATLDKLNTRQEILTVAVQKEAERINEVSSTKEEIFMTGSCWYENFIGKSSAWFGSHVGSYKHL